MRTSRKLSPRQNKTETVILDSFQDDGIFTTIYTHANMTQKDTTQDEIIDIEAELQEDISVATESEEEIEVDLENGNISDAEEELMKLRASLVRAQADYMNLLKRVDRDKADMTSFMTANVVKKFIPTLDNLERAVASVPADIASHAWTDGIRATLQGLTKQLDGLGVHSFESMGQEVDGEKHDVMSQAPGKEGVVITEFEKGYMLHDKVIRHAKVIV